MAFINSSENEDENENSQGMNQTEAQAPAAPVQLSNQSSTSSSPIPKTATAKPVSSGSAPGFQNYTKANTGKAQDSLNSSVAQNVQNVGQKATNSINQATTSFGQKVDTGTLENRQNALLDVQNTVNSARNISAGSAVDPTQQNRFKEVINTQYQGPESLRQSGLYSKAAGNVDTAQTALNNTKTSTGREELLRGMYQQRGDYTAGLNKLDSALLNSSKQGVQNLQNTAAAQGNIAQNLDKAQISSANLAQNRTNEINQIKQQARDAFTTGKTAEEAATEARLKGVTDNWDALPDYFKNIIKNKNSPEAVATRINDFKTANNYSAAEQALAAANVALQKRIPFIGQTGIKTSIEDPKARAAYNQALAAKNALDSNISSLSNEKTTLLSPEEAATLGVSSGEGLYNLGAGTIGTKAAEKDRLISKNEQARQAALASLAGLDQSNLLSKNVLYGDASKAGTQKASDALDLVKTRQLLNEAEQGFRDNADRTITGTGSKKNKTSGKRYSASESANLKDLLSRGGYDFDSKLKNEFSSNEDALNAVTNGTSREVTPDPTAAAAAREAQMSGISPAGGKSVATNFGNYVGSAIGANYLTGALGMGGVGDAISSVLGTGANSRASKNKAQQLANQDLRNKITGALTSSGFENRLNVQDNTETKTRLAALQALLQNMDKTNS